MEELVMTVVCYALVVLGLWLIAFNWYSVIQNNIRKIKAPSWIPLFASLPAVAGIASGLTVIPQHFWWAPALLDPAGVLIHLVLIYELMTKTGSFSDKEESWLPTAFSTAVPA